MGVSDRLEHAWLNYSVKDMGEHANVSCERRVKKHAVSECTKLRTCTCHHPVVTPMEQGGDDHIRGRSLCGPCGVV